MSAYALEKYPEYKGMTGHEEVDCLKAKAKLVVFVVVLSLK